MTRSLFPNSIARKPDGSIYAYAPFTLELLTKAAARTDEAYPTRPLYKFVTDANGRFPTNLTIPTPETGAWRWRLHMPDRQRLEAYIEQGDGSAVEIDDWITLSGAAGNEAGTPEMEWLRGLRTAVAGADDGLLLETADGDLALTNAPRGYWMQRTAVPAGETVTIPADHQMVVVGDFIVDGELIAVGDLVILG